MTKEEEEFRQLLKEISILDELEQLLDWDSQTHNPEAAAEMRADVVAYISKLSVDRQTSDKMAELLNKFSKNPDLLSEDGKKIYRRVNREFNIQRKIPNDDAAEYSKLLSKAQAVWIKARRAKDFNIFKPYLKQIIDFNKKFIGLWKTTEQTNYDVLLNHFEPGMTVAKLDPIFATLKQAIKTLMNKLKTGIEPNDQFMHRYVSKVTQEKISRDFITRLSFNYEQGDLDISEHPFTLGLNRNDARITTRYDIHDFQMSLLGTIHEAGHAIYEQNVDPKWARTTLSGGTSMGIHESQSLFNEIMIGRNYYYWIKEYPRLRELTGETFSDIDFETFYRGFNTVHPSLIRTEADPITYILHIIVRYEIEKAIFNDDISLDNLNQIWNEKYEEYLGICPQNDTEGILQDIHWAGGDIGYFPSYALGHLYAAQFLHAMKQDFDVDKALAEGNINLNTDWRKDNIFQYGCSKDPNEILMDATGEELNPDYWIQHQNEVYKYVYQLN